MSRGEGFYKDLKGKRFGNLTVICFSRNVNSYAMWKCRCVCGGEKEVTRSSLVAGHVKSCGCLGGGKQLPYGESSFNHLFSSYRSGARNRSLSFRLSKKQIRKLTQMNCHYCGSPPSRIWKCAKYARGEYVYNGIDRIDNRYGYSVKNCVPCCKICNYAKRNVSQEEFLNWLKRVGPQKSDRRRKKC